MRKSKFILVALPILLILALVAFPLAVSAKPALIKPKMVPGLGLTAAYIAQPGEAHNRDDY